MGKQPNESRSIYTTDRLGDFVLQPYRFPDLQEEVASFKEPSFSLLNHKEKSELVNRKLLELIQAAPPISFLLIGVVEYVDLINRERILHNYSISSFELWLNQFSGLNDGENYQVRSRIVGKELPRDAYQSIFPVGMGKIHPGSHFVTAHASPDLDTTIASFWGWVDAFGARVSEGLHVWNVPGGAPPSSIEVALLFHHIFGQNVFELLCKKKDTLTLSSLELMTQRGVVKQKTDQSSVSIDHERTNKAVILVDNEGYYLGDWRNFDVEGVRQVLMLLSNCLRWFENNLHVEIVSLFARESLSLKDLPSFIERVFDSQLRTSPPAEEFTEKQARYMENYLKKVLHAKQGLDVTFAELAEKLNELKVPGFKICLDKVRGLSSSVLFDKSGNLIEDRPKIFHHVEEIITLLDQAIYEIRLYTERLEVALNIKTEVFGYLPQVVSYRADVGEIKSKMGNYPYLTVTSSDEEGKMLPLGVVRSRDLQQPILGTVTLRDFCNRDETKIPSYFEVISVIDHHKVILNTSASPVAYITDAQSTNSVVAELAFVINDQYGSGGMSQQDIERQMNELKGNLDTPSKRRLMQRLLHRLGASQRTEGGVDPLREFVEYLHFLYAILDDTDLLTKVSRRDVDVVAALLNRLRSLLDGKEQEIIHFDDISQGPAFVQKAATRILQHPEMYSVYQKIYVAKEQLVEENLTLCAAGKESSIFVDTKLQNGCVRVGQTKMFASNHPSFDSHSDDLRKGWVSESKVFFQDRREVDLHLHMISTIAGAEEVYKGNEEASKYTDELWLWIPMTELSMAHLKEFLHDFRSSPQLQDAIPEVNAILYGENAGELKKIFRESFIPSISIKEKSDQGESLAVIRYPAGTINSRKAMISPYLPKLLS